MNAARAEECSVGVELAEEPVGVGSRAGPVACPDLATGDKQLDISPAGQFHRGRYRVSQNPAAEGQRQRPRDLERRGTDIDDDRFLGLDQACRESCDGPLALDVPDAPDGETALARSARWPGRSAVDAVKQAVAFQRAQLAPDVLDRHGEAA